MLFNKKCGPDVNYIFIEYDSNKKNWSYVVSEYVVKLLNLGEIKDIEKDLVDVILKSGMKLEIKFIKFLTLKHSKISRDIQSVINKPDKKINAMIFSTLTAKFSTEKQEFILPFTLCLNAVYIPVAEIIECDSVTEAASKVTNEFKVHYARDEIELNPDIAHFGVLIEKIQNNTKQEIKSEVNELKSEVKSEVNELKSEINEIKNLLQQLLKKL